MPDYLEFSMLSQHMDYFETEYFEQLFNSVEELERSLKEEINV
jgi:hypothetical protein